jgi:hypothetical protein
MAALLDGQQPITLGQPDRGLRQPPTHPGSGGDSVDAQPAGAVAGDLVPDDPQDRELPSSEPRSERGRHRT